MNIRYKKAMGISYIVIGILFACLYFVLAFSGGREFLLITFGFLSILFGILFMTRTYFVLTEDSLVLNAILGPAKTTYPFKSITEIEIEDNKIFMNQDGQRKKLPISAWMIDRKDWQAFVQKVKNAQG